MGGGAYMSRGLIRGVTCVKEKAGLSAGGRAYRRRNKVL